MNGLLNKYPLKNYWFTAKFYKHNMAELSNQCSKNLAKLPERLLLIFSDRIIVIIMVSTYLTLKVPNSKRLKLRVLHTLISISHHGNTIGNNASLQIRKLRFSVLSNFQTSYHEKE